MTSTNSSLVRGMCDPKFANVQAALEANIASGRDVGASIAVTINGEMVVDMWGGWVDEARSAEWQADTIVNVWSTTKTMAALSMLLLVERGSVDVDQPVAKYWPEFAQNGKENVLVRHIMSHTSGVSGWDQPVVIEDILDWDDAVDRLAGQAPWWEPGTASGYHMLNYGHLVGEVVRRVSGKSLGTFFKEEIAQPLGADFHIGLAESEFGRVSPVIPPPPIPVDLAGLDMNSPMIKTFTGPPPMDATYSATTGWRKAEIPGANGHGNARSVALIQSIVANGGSVDGKKFLSPETIELIFRRQSDNPDLVLGLPLRFGIGYALPQPASIPYIPEGKVCFWGGWGGSLIVIDTERKMSIAYMMNRMDVGETGVIGDARGEQYMRAVFGALGVSLP